MPDPAVAGSLRTEVELHVADVARSVAFYEALGFVVTRRWEDWIRLDRGGAGLVLMGDAYVRGHDHYFTPHLDHSPRGVAVEIVIEVDDVAAARLAADAAVTAGGGLARVVKEITVRPWKARDFRLADPDGFFLRISSALAHER